MPRPYCTSAARRNGRARPRRDQLDALYRAPCVRPIRRPDAMAVHRFSGEGLDRLGELYTKADSVSIRTSTTAPGCRAQKPKRAPMVIAVIAKVTPGHPKVPRIEQLLSAGCAAHGILLAAQAQGLGAMWRTGHYAFDPTVREGLGLAEDDELVGFLYLGQMGGRHKPLPERDPSDFIERWS